MDLRESMRDSPKFFHQGLCVPLAAKLYCLETFMEYSNQTLIYSKVLLSRGVGDQFLCQQTMSQAVC